MTDVQSDLRDGYLPVQQFEVTSAEMPRAFGGALTEQLESPFRPARVSSEPFGEGETTTGTPTLRRGDKGESVGRLQTLLSSAGFPLAVDRDFGAGTLAAVRAFQTRAGLVADGVVGTSTWNRLISAPASAPAHTAPVQTAPARPAAPVGGPGAQGMPPPTPLGTLTVTAPNREFSYAFTASDLLWTAKLLVHETGGADDADSAAVLWAMINRYGLFAHIKFPSFSSFVRAYSTTLQPVLLNWRAAQRHVNSPQFVKLGGFYTGNPQIPRGQLQRHIDIQNAPWSSIKSSARTLAARALAGQLPNPGIGLASEFASTRVYYRQNHNGAEPSNEQWRAYTIAMAATKKWRWVGDIPHLNQRKNAFFLDLRARNLSADAVKVLQPASGGGEAEQFVGEQFEAEQFGLDEFDGEYFGEVVFSPSPQSLAEDEPGEDSMVERAYQYSGDYEGDVGSATEWEHGAAEPGWAGEAEADLSAVISRALIGIHVAAGRRPGGPALDPNELTNKVFFSRHPQLRGTKLPPSGTPLGREWVQIRNEVVAPMLLSGPAIGPIHGAPQVRAKVPADAVISPLSTTVRGLRRGFRRRQGALGAIVIHNTSRGPADKSAKAGYRRAAVDFALDHYLDHTEGFPHYVVDFNGTIYATCDERFQAWHATWKGIGGGSYFRGTWTPRSWWTSIWNPLGVRTPLDLLPSGANLPNERSIGIELMITPTLGYTPQQYSALARLVVDIATRQQLTIDRAPSKALLGHEDYAPFPLEPLMGREGQGGGFDPGAHRDSPFFSWSRLWTEIRSASPSFGASENEDAYPAELEFGEWEDEGETSDDSPGESVEQESAGWFESAGSSGVTGG